MNMKLTDLRIGNLIYDDEGIISKINGFTPFDHSTRCDELEGCLLLIDIYKPNGEISKGFECDINYTKPIELTEEWLLKMAFEKRADWQFLNDKLVVEIWLDIPTKFDVRFRINENESILITEINYVHQLQNLYYTLTGEELTIK